MKLVAPTVPNHTPTDRAGHYLLISQVFNTFCLFFFCFYYIHCSNGQCRKDFLCAWFSSAEFTSRYAFEQSLMVLLQLQAADCEISFVLRLDPLIVKKPKCCLIECRAAAVFSKDSRRWFGILRSSLCEKQVALFYVFPPTPSILLVLEHALNIIYHKKRGKKPSPRATCAVCLTTSLSVVNITRCCWSSLAF